MLCTPCARAVVRAPYSFSLFIRSAGSATFQFPAIPTVDYTSSIDWLQIYDTKQPLIIRGLVRDWPAISDNHRSWGDLKALRCRIAEDMVVPVEIGNSYMAADMQKAHVDLRSLLQYFDESSETSEGAVNGRAVNKPRVYWAQHDLSDVPAMLADVAAPVMCGVTGRGGGVYRTNIWFCGRQGSLSPCHHDPYDNLLCQVLGEKEVTLFAPDFGHAHLYPAIGTLQANTAQVDVTDPDLLAFPGYGEGLQRIQDQGTVGGGGVLLGARGELRPGDALFIPRKWWHACVSRGLGCSVNFWWL